MGNTLSEVHSLTSVQAEPFRTHDDAGCSFRRDPSDNEVGSDEAAPEGQRDQEPSRCGDLHLKCQSLYCRGCNGDFVMSNLTSYLSNTLGWP